jgi:hypothetical protein
VTTSYRISVLFITLLMALAGMVTVSAAPSMATTYSSIMQANAGTYWCTSTSAVCERSFTTVSKGTDVRMVCWQDGRTATGVYASNRWFYVQMASGLEGFVHSSNISTKTQTATPACTTLLWFKAMTWALGQDGQQKVPANAKNGNVVTYWSGWCWLFAYDAWNLGAGHTPRYSGADAQAAYGSYSSHKLVQPPTSSPPPGSMVFFAYRKLGHVAISLGDGWIETTQDIGTTLPVTHMKISTQGLTQLGYVLPSNV